MQSNQLIFSSHSQNGNDKQMTNILHLSQNKFNDQRSRGKERSVERNMDSRI